MHPDFANGGEVGSPGAKTARLPCAAKCFPMGYMSASDTVYVTWLHCCVSNCSACAMCVPLSIIRAASCNQVKGSAHHVLHIV
jgi:hypothetical protein